jgi:hypothetical protein
MKSAYDVVCSFCLNNSDPEGGQHDMLQTQQGRTTLGRTAAGLHNTGTYTNGKVSYLVLAQRSPSAFLHDQVTK